MGWEISMKEYKAETKYKIWSTVTDSYITPKWLTKDEVIKFMFWHKLDRFMADFVETAVTFPNDWYIKELDRRMYEEVNTKKYSDLLKESIHNRETFPREFIKILKDLNIELSVKDGRYFINTKKDEQDS
jgi:hypothetical protein